MRALARPMTRALVALSCCLLAGCPLQPASDTRPSSSLTASSSTVTAAAASVPTAAPSASATAPPAPVMPAGWQKMEYVAWAPSARGLAIWCGEACAQDVFPVLVWDLTAGKLRGTLPGDPRLAGRGVKWTAGDAFIGLGAYMAVSFFRASDLAPFAEARDNFIYDSFFPGPKTQAVLWLNGYGVRAIDLQTKATAKGFDFHDSAAMYAMTAVWSPAGDRAAITHEYEALRLVTPSAGKIAVLKIASSKTPAPTSVVWNEKGTELFVAQADGAVARVQSSGKLLDLLRPPQLEEGGEGHETKLALAPDGASLAAADGDGTVTLWGLSPKPVARALAAAAGPASRVDAASFSPDGRWLAVARNGAVQVLQATGAPSPIEVVRVTGTTAPASPSLVHWDATGTLRVITGEGELVTWSSKTAASPMKKPLGAVTFAVPSPDGRFLAAVHGDVTVVRLRDDASLAFRAIKRDQTSNCEAIDKGGAPLSADAVKAFFAP
jgi:WD40 repeat protein